MQKSKYSEIRELVKPGDIIAFGGRSLWSRVIQFWTKSPVSHVGIVMRVNIGSESINQLIEATTLDGFAGVVTSRLSARIAQYDGAIWWLPLSKADRAVLDYDGFYEFLFKQSGKSYDPGGAIRAGLDRLDKIPLLRRLTYNRENFEKLYCAELAVGALEAAGVFWRAINASEVTPIDLCHYQIYSGDYAQIKGRTCKIAGYNSKLQKNQATV